MAVDKPGVRGIRSVQGLPNVFKISPDCRKVADKIFIFLHSRSEVHLDVPVSMPHLLLAHFIHGTLS